MLSLGHFSSIALKNFQKDGNFDFNIPRDFAADQDPELWIREPSSPYPPGQRKRRPVRISGNYKKCAPDTASVSQAKPAEDSTSGAPALDVIPGWLCNMNRSDVMHV